MVTAYSKEHLEKYDVVEERYADNKIPDAKQIRDKKARELRKEGYDVETERYSVFGDYVYTIDAKKLKDNKTLKTYTKSELSDEIEKAHRTDWTEEQIDEYVAPFIKELHQREGINMSHHDNEISRINKGRTTIEDVKRINKEKDRHFFDRDTMRFFKSKIEKDQLRFGQLIDDKYFVTSEQYDESSPRLFTVRRFNPKEGSINTVGEFQEFKRKATARDFAWCLADHDGDVEKCREIIK